jgi:glutaredoxin
LLTTTISKVELGRVYSIQGEMAQDIFKDKLAYSFFEEKVCSQESFSQISKDLGYSGSIINSLEEKLGKEDERVLEQKKFYTLVLLEHLEFLKDYNSICNTSLDYILFFYSNQKGQYKSSENLGKMLDVLTVEKQNVSVYSFDINLDSELIEKLVKKYNITQAPTIVINGNVKLEEVQSINEVKSYLE